MTRPIETETETKGDQMADEKVESKVWYKRSGNWMLAIGILLQIVQEYAGLDPATIAEGALTVVDKITALLAIGATASGVAKINNLKKPG